MQYPGHGSPVGRDSAEPWENGLVNDCPRCPDRPRRRMHARYTRCGVLGVQVNTQLCGELGMVAVLLTDCALRRFQPAEPVLDELAEFPATMAAPSAASWSNTVMNH